MQVFFNGSYMPFDQVKISPFDRGFLFGDGGYEVVPIYSGQFFRATQHLQRLSQTLMALRIDNPYTLIEWQDYMAELLAANPSADALKALYIHVTRGVEAVRDHAPKALLPTVFMAVWPINTMPVGQQAQGCRVVSAVDTRWHNCHLKTVSLVANIMLRQISVDAGVLETVLFRDGYLTEATASNVFVVRDGALFAPPKSSLILPGITYDVVLELAEEIKLPVHVQPISQHDVFAADEVWLTSSTKEILPVIQLDEQIIGTGRPGPIALSMLDAYRAMIKQLVSA